METKEQYAIEVSNAVQLGSMVVANSSQVVGQASVLAKELAHLIEDRKLFNNISGRRYVRVEGWSTLGAMLGVLPREVYVEEKENGDFEASVELVRANDGHIIGRGSAIVGADEPTWKSRPRYARRSMAITRATGKAFRLGFSWIMTLAGYEPTPAEEMMDFVDAEVIEKPRISRPAAPIVPSATAQVTHMVPPAAKPVMWAGLEASAAMTLDEAMAITGSDGKKYGDCDDKELSGKMIGLQKALKGNIDGKKQDEYLRKLQAANMIISSRTQSAIPGTQAG